MNNILLGILGGVALFFVIKKSKTFAITDGKLEQLEEFILTDLPQRLPDLDSRLIAKPAVEPVDPFRGVDVAFEF